MMRPSYVEQLRRRVGHELLLLPGVQIVCESSGGELLLQQRTDDRLWALPAGACEPGQSFRDAAHVELQEESGLIVAVEDLVPFATLSEPRLHTLRYPNGDQVHAFALCFLATRWGGQLRLSSEVRGHRFVRADALPEPLHRPTRVVIDLLRRFRETGQFQAS